MSRNLSLVVIFVTVVQWFYGQVDTLAVHYYENYPFAYTEAGKLKGIEIEIVEAYVGWLKQNKNVIVNTKYKGFGDFVAFYNSILDGSTNVLGLGAVADNKERRRGVVFSPPYLENTAVLITDGSIATIKTKDPAEVATVLNTMKPLVVTKSNHLAYMNEVIKVYDQTQLEVPDLIVSFTEKQADLLQKINTDKAVFGFVNIIEFWIYVKANPTKFLKMQKVFNEPREFLGFIMPKRNAHSQYLNEFFESGFGFTATKTYRHILEKYLDFEIVESVEIK